MTNRPMQPPGQTPTLVISNAYIRNLADLADSRLAAATLALSGAQPAERLRPSLRSHRGLVS